MPADLRLTPINPTSSLSGFFAISALTPAGQEFLALWFPGQNRIDQEHKTRLETVAEARGLTVETDWSCVLDPLVD